MIVKVLECPCGCNALSTDAFPLTSLLMNLDTCIKNTVEYNMKVYRDFIPFYSACICNNYASSTKTN
jgi:hypothetical protein